MPRDQPEEFKTSSMCMPIDPCSEHPAGREPLHPSKPFPFPNCYQHSFGWTTVRIPTRHIDFCDAAMLSVKERMRRERYLGEDWAQHKALRPQQSPPPVEMEKTTTFSEILQAVDCSEDQDGAPCTHEDAVSEHFDVAITTEDDCTPTLNSDTDTEYSDSVDSTDTDALVNAAYDMEDLYVMFDAFLFSKLSDPAFDLIPLVKVSYDLTARGEPADPRGFLEEAKFMAELIRKARDGTLEDVSDSGAVVSVISFDDVQKEECLVLDSPASDSNTGTSIVEDIPECAGPATTVTEHLADTPPEAQPETEDRPLFPEADPSPHTAEKDVVNTSSRSLKGS
ncbi:hypothetical protein IEO21_03703 [Rhodonia placenta]|uniref:Uncharacterized protein n=1 Tax=Rhodonia placenta TaxID=104341 RepID=A0A8H7P5B5_9APHY|nr:hypothetical protein IEO21_03703 [Postia placenta]